MGKYEAWGAVREWLRLAKGGRGVLAAAGAVLAVSVAAAGVFGPGPNSTGTAAGDDLSIALSSPLDGTSIPMPPGETDVEGGCTINTTPGQPVCLLYVLDVSGSTDGAEGIDADGNGTVDAADNLNAPSGDAEVGEVLDAEIAAALAIHAAVGNLSSVRTGALAFATSGAAADVGFAGGFQHFLVPPQLDANAANGIDIEEVLRSFRSEDGPGGSIDVFTPIGTGTLGNLSGFKNALAAMNEALTHCQQPATNVVFFFSDGASDQPRCEDGGCAAELATANAAGTIIHSIAIGPDADVDDIAFLADSTGGTYTDVEDPSDLVAAVAQIRPSGIDRVEVDGIQVPLDALGNFSRRITCSSPGPITVTATCYADDFDEINGQSHVSADLMLSCGLLCGDSVVDPGAGEECEPPGTPTCDATCRRVPVCGDGFVDDPEQCEGPGQGACDASCMLTSCGDLVVQSPAEECEPPSTPTCDDACQRVPLCGDGLVDAPEGCEPPGTATCDADCTPIVCGNAEVEAGEECDPPVVDLCDLQCQRVPVCNDGHVDPPEECEPAGTSTCDVDCTRIACGNGEVEPGEECDPPVAGSCDAHCQRVPACGDGQVDPPEECDGGPGCDTSCALIACGNGVLQPGEECDPPGPNCDASCQRVPQCGDGSIDAPEGCEPPGTSTCDTDCTPIACGNGDIEAGEECDPPAAGLCDVSCQRVPRCGDGAIDPPEQCEPPDTLNCDAACQLIECGNGVVQPGEECDPPAAGVCDATCQRVPVCGDGFLDSGEQCEPPNTPACDAQCQNQEICLNEIDDDGDGLIDCSDSIGNDPDCPPCVMPRKDPARIRFRKQPSDLDRLEAHGRFDVGPAFDPGSSDAAILLQGLDGEVIYRAFLPAGSLVTHGKNYVWRTRHPGDGDGIAMLALRKKGPATWTFTLKASADLSAATGPDMRFAIRVGEEAFSLARRWKKKSYGWYMPFL